MLLSMGMCRIAIITRERSTCKPISHNFLLANPTYWRCYNRHFTVVFIAHGQTKSVISHENGQDQYTYMVYSYVGLLIALQILSALLGRQSTLVARVILSRDYLVHLVTMRTTLSEFCWCRINHGMQWFSFNWMQFDRRSSRCSKWNVMWLKSSRLHGSQNVYLWQDWFDISSRITYVCSVHVPDLIVITFCNQHHFQ